MPHRVHPYAHRLGIIRDWKSRWFAKHAKYRNFLRSDLMIREFLEKRLKSMYISLIEIERGEKTVRIIIKTSRPGMIIGRSGEGTEKLRNDLMKFIKKNKLTDQQEVKIDIEEIKSPESNAAIVVQMISESLEKRMPHRRVMKQIVEKVMANRDVLGVKVYIGGRLGGTDIARSETMKRGQIPLQTLRADIDYATGRATIAQGDLGVKVWIYKGEVFNK